MMMTFKATGRLASQKYLRRRKKKRENRRRRRTKGSCTRILAVMERPRGRLWDSLDYQRREIGSLPPLTFARRAGGREDLVRRIQLYAELNGHSGCVNTVHFSPSGDILVSGSDDRDIVLWDWAAKSKKLTFASGHDDNVFQARIMPFSDDGIIISCAADGQVRQANILEGGMVETKKLAQHQGRVHKLAIEPGSSRIFMSCGEDGVVRRFDLRDGSNRSTFKCQTLVGSSKVRRHPVLLNAIVINPINPLYFAVAGSDRYARIYDIRKVPWGEQNIDDNPVIAHVPAHLKGKGPVNATALAYSYQEEVLVSYNDEHVYLFGNSKVSGSSHQASEEGKTPISTSELQVYKGHRNSRTVKGVNFFGLNSEYVVSGSDCGNVFIWKKKNSELIALFKGDTQIVNCLEPHPHIPVLATSGLENTAKIWGPISDEDYAALADDAEMIMELNRRGREESSEYFSNVMHVLRLQRRHVQPELASWYSQGEDRGHPGENSDDEGNAADDYMMVLYTATDNEEDEQMNGQECNIS